WYVSDGARKAALVFQIDDFNAFKTSTERLEGEKVSLGGFQWHIRCYVTDGMLSLVLVATHPTQPVWHCKAEFGLRAETDRDYYSKSTEIFANTCPAWGWVKLASVYNVGRFLKGNIFKVSVEVRVFNCYVTDGAYGIWTRFHDVVLIFPDDRNKRLHANKGFLAANSEFFEGLFFGSFADPDQEEAQLTRVKSDAVAAFLIAIAPGAPTIREKNIVTLLRMADRFQAPQLTEQCLDVILKNTHVKMPFVQKLQLADELELSQFR
ncbi:Protein BTB-1, partial [Aphelenchoides avenae]